LKSLPGAGGDFQHFQSRPHLRDVAKQRRSIEFHRVGKIDLCDDGDVRGVED